MSCCRPEIHHPHVTLVHWLVLFHGMTTLILEIDCVALHEQRLHVHLWPAKLEPRLEGRYPLKVFRGFVPISATHSLFYSLFFIPMQRCGRPPRLTAPILKMASGPGRSMLAANLKSDIRYHERKQAETHDTHQRIRGICQVGLQHLAQRKAS